jgi:hypothetical protein
MGGKMKKKKMVSLIGMVLLFCMGGLAQEGYIHVSPAGWDVWDGSAGFEFFGGEVGSTAYMTKTTSPDHLMRPLEFPPEADGLLVRQITISYYDAESTHNLRFYLRKVDLYDQSATTVAGISSSGSSTSWRRMYINRWDMIARRINNQRYAWYLIVFFEDSDTNLSLGNVKIKYAAD